jgi:hypothetical protein
MLHKRFTRVILFGLLATSLLVVLPSPAFAGPRVGVGFYGGGYWGGPYWGYPYAYGPYGYGYGRPLGEVKIKSPDNDAQIYINGAFAGRAHDLKHFYLVPGTYNFEQRIGSDVKKVRVYVIANRTLKLDFDKPGVVHNQPPAPAPQAAPVSQRPDAVPAPPPPQDAPPAPAPPPPAQ